MLLGIVALCVLLPSVLFHATNDARASGALLFSDNFDDNSIDITKWTVVNSGYSLAETNGQIEMTVREQQETLAVLRGANFAQAFDASDGVDANVDIARHVADTGGWVARPDLRVHSADGTKWIRLFYDPYYGVVRLSDSLGNVQTVSDSGSDTGFHHFRIVATGSNYTGYYDSTSASLTTSLLNGVVSARVELQEQSGGTTFGVTETSAHDNVAVYSYSLGSPPGAPTGLSATSYQNGQVPLSWTAPASSGSAPITDYSIYRGTSPGGETYYSRTHGFNTSYVDSGVVNGQTYYYKVAAVNSVGTGARSGEASALPAATPGAPTGLMATPGPGAGETDLSWQAPSNTGGTAITSYNIYRGNASGAESFLAQVGNTLTYVDANCSLGTTCYYEVAAVNAVGEGPRSNEAASAGTAVPPCSTCADPNSQPYNAGQGVFVDCPGDIPSDPGGNSAGGACFPLTGTEATMQIVIHDSTFSSNVAGAWSLQDASGARADGVFCDTTGSVNIGSVLPGATTLRVWVGAYPQAKGAGCGLPTSGAATTGTIDVAYT